jgi:hypothetical protein
VCWSPWNEDHIFSATSDGRVIACAVESHFNDVLQPQHTSSVLALAVLLLLPAPLTSNPPPKAVISCAAGDVKCWVSSSHLGEAESINLKRKGSSSWQQLQLLPADDASSVACSSCSCICSRGTTSTLGSVIIGSDNGWIHLVSIESVGNIRLLRSHRSHTQAVTCLDIDANGSVASGGKDGSVAVAQGLFCGDDAGISYCKGLCDGAVVAVRFCRVDASLLASCSLETSVTIWGFSAEESSCNLVPLKLFAACVGRLTCLEWVSQSSDAVIVGGEHQAVIEIFWRLQPDADVQSAPGALKLEAGVAGSKVSKAKRQRRDDSTSHNSAESTLERDLVVDLVETGARAAVSASSVILDGAAAGVTMVALDAPAIKHSSHLPPRQSAGSSKSDTSKRKFAEKSVLNRGSATSAVTAVARPVSDAVQSLMCLHSAASGVSSIPKENLLSPTLSEIMCERTSRVAWVGECVLAAAKNPSTSDAAVAVSSLAGVGAYAALCLVLSLNALAFTQLTVYVLRHNFFRYFTVLSAEVRCPRQHAVACGRSCTSC